MGKTGNLVILGPRSGWAQTLQGLFQQIPYATEQGISKCEQGTLSADQGTFRVEQGTSGLTKFREAIAPASARCASGGDRKDRSVVQVHNDGRCNPRDCGRARR